MQNRALGVCERPAEPQGSMHMPQSSAQLESAAQPIAVLLVEDDYLVAESAAVMLEELGHVATSALSAAKALELVRGGAHFDLVITDFAMPGMNGLLLAEELRRIDPDLPILLMTGFADTSGRGSGGLPRLEKPFTIEKLALQVDSLARRSARRA